MTNSIPSDQEEQKVISEIYYPGAVIRLRGKGPLEIGDYVEIAQYSESDGVAIFTRSAKSDDVTILARSAKIVAIRSTENVDGGVCEKCEDTVDVLLCRTICFYES